MATVDSAASRAATARTAAPAARGRRSRASPKAGTNRVLIARAGGVVEIAEERCAAALQVIAEALMDFATRPLLRLADQPRSVGPEIQRDPPIGAAQRSPAGPDHLAHRDQLVKELRPILAYPNREHVPFEHRRRDGTALELEDDLGEPIESARLNADAVPARQETTQDVDRHRLDLASQRRQ